MNPIIQQAMNLFRQGIISQTQLDKLMAQFTPQNTQTAPPQGEVPAQGNLQPLPQLTPTMTGQLYAPFLSTYMNERPPQNNPPTIYGGIRG